MVVRLPTVDPEGINGGVSEIAALAEVNGGEVGVTVRKRGDGGISYVRRHITLVVS